MENKRRHKNSTPPPLISWRSDNRKIEVIHFDNSFTAVATKKRDLKMGVEKYSVENKIDKSMSEDLYRPPALRNRNNEFGRDEENPAKLVTNVNSENIETKKHTSLSTSAAATASILTTTSISCNNSPIHRNENIIINNCTTSTQQNSTCGFYQQVDKQQKQTQRQKQTRRERRPDRAVYIPRARRSQTTPPTSQIQPPTHQQQLPLLAPTTSDETSKSLNQQLTTALDDTTTDSVCYKPSPKAVEVGKAHTGVVIDSTYCNNLTTTINKQKLNKESREQRRDKRLLKKLSTASTQQIQNYKHNEKLTENSINTISNNDNGDEILNQAFITNVQQIQQSSLLNSDFNNFSELNDISNNLSKCLNCDSSDEHVLSEESNLSAHKTEIREFDFFAINPESDIEFVNNYNLNTFKSQFLYKPAQSTETNCKTTASNTSNLENVANINIIINSCNTNTMPQPLMKTKSSKANSSAIHDHTKLPNLRIDDIASQQLLTKYDVEEQEFQRASKEINRSNRRIIKQTFTSDILQIPHHVNEDENEEKTSVANKEDDNNESVVTKESQPTIQVDIFTEEEDDWENMFNDSGECLDPKIMQELTASVGKFKIELPKMDYSAFLTKQSILNEEEFPHVLEVSNFPVEFKNQDLLMVFSQYKESGFDIKWVDDTHALAVFSSSRIAAEVLTMGHPFVLLKPLAEATIESRLKAKKFAASLQPYRPRPETCAALARRLVTGALGVRLKTAAAERENEKRVLREAKERKLLAAKQRDEIWDS